MKHACTKKHQDNWQKYKHTESGIMENTEIVIQSICNNGTECANKTNNQIGMNDVYITSDDGIGNIQEDIIYEEVDAQVFIEEKTVVRNVFDDDENHCGITAEPCSSNPHFNDYEPVVSLVESKTFLIKTRAIQRHQNIIEI